MPAVSDSQFTPKTTQPTVLALESVEIASLGDGDVGFVQAGDVYYSLDLQSVLIEDGAAVLWTRNSNPLFGAPAGTPGRWVLLSTALGPGIKPSALNKNMVALVTAVDNDLATLTPIAATPFGYVEAQINGLTVDVGNGIKIGVSGYFSGDGGVTARAFGSIVAGDTFRWNGSVAGFQLAASDRINFLYEA